MQAMFTALDATVVAKTGPALTPQLSRIQAPAHEPKRGLYQVLGRRDRHELAAHFRSLRQPDRIARFHGGMSDEAVTAYVFEIDWTQHWVVAYRPFERIAAIAEVVSHPIRGWARCELVLSVALRELPPQVRADIVQITLFGARERGCREIDMPPGWREFLQLSYEPTLESAAIVQSTDGERVNLDVWFGSDEVGVTAGQ